MQKKLTIGRTYAVTASTTCDVTDANGALITTAYPGQQIVFVAPTTTVSFTDDAASVVAVFNSALVKTRLFEQLGGGRLPTGYMPALFLESTGAQYINTGIIPFTGAEKCTVGMEIDGLVTGPGSNTSCMIAGCGASGSAWFSPYRWWNEESAYTAFFLQQNEYPVSSPYNNRIRCSLNFLESGVVKYSANGGDAKTVSITHAVKDLREVL